MSRTEGPWALLLVALGAAACGRSPLYDPAPAADAAGAGRGDARDAAAERAPDLAPEQAPDRAPDRTPDQPVDTPAAAEHAPPEAGDAPGACQPQPEICNGRDDDCDGQVDEDQPPVPCPGGGSRYCVAGRLSECPQRCEVCVPGSRRTCMLSYCTYWGAQACAADGRSFGSCRESPPPPECAAIAGDKKRSAELEQCCLDNGYCCVDDFDLDHDGDRTEMLGRCAGVVCTP